MNSFVIESLEFENITTEAHTSISLKEMCKLAHYFKYER